jgi:steroid delta-isomerase-like uncharacterized protein
MGESEAIVKKCFDALNRKDVDGFLALFSEEISGHWNGITGDLKGLHYHYSKWFEAFPDAKAHVKRVFSSGDWAAAEFTWEVTHTGEWPGLPQITPAGKEAKIEAALFAEVKAGKIGYLGVYWNLKKLEKDLLG